MKNITKDDIEMMDSDEIEECVYLPEDKKVELECEDGVYDVHVYYALEWPSQTVCSFEKSKIIANSNPEKGASKIYSIDFTNNKKCNDISDNDVCTYTVKYNYNRIRSFNNILGAVSDNSFDIYKDFELVEEINTIKPGYGLCASLEGFYYSDVGGKIYSYKDGHADSFKVHNGSIESLFCDGNLIFSASTDMTIKVSDVRMKKPIIEKKYDCDINAISYSPGSSKIVFGDDIGIIRLTDIRNYETDEEIKWHKSSINSIVWKDSDTFLAASEEQVCIYDISLEEEWEYEKYLLFVHQGQESYKDICCAGWDNDLFVATSLDGLCFFKPANFENEN